MKCYIADTVIGFFVFDDTENPVSFRDFEGDFKKIVDLYNSINENNLHQDIIGLIKEISESGYNEIIVDNPKLGTLIEQNSGVKIRVEAPCRSIQFFKLNLSEKIKLFGLQVSEEKIGEFSRNLSETLTKKSISRTSGSEDLIIAQITTTLDLLKKSINLFSIRIREWYGLHFPELTDQLIEDHILFNKLISKIGSREKFTRDSLQTEFSFKEAKLNVLIGQARNSMGGEINLDTVQKYADLILSVDSYRTLLESELEGIMQKAVPNITNLVGSLIGAKLITVAGSIRKLALLPASTIQLLGAERALFRAKVSNAKSPKHGLIFQWHGIRAAKPWHRGKISRLLAGKISIAAKIDYFSDRDEGDKLLNEVNQKIEEIKLKFPNPPKKTKETRQQKPFSKKKGKRRY